MSTTAGTAAAMMMCTVPACEEAVLSEAVVGTPLCEEVGVDTDVVNGPAKPAVLVTTIVVNAPDASVTIEDAGEGAAVGDGPALDVARDETSGSSSSLQSSNSA